MDINDPRYRLRVLNQSNPSIRIQVAPTQRSPSISQPSGSQQISIAQPKPLPDIAIPGVPNSSQQSPSFHSWSVPTTPKSGPLGSDGNGGVNLGHFFGSGFLENVINSPEKIARGVQRAESGDIEGGLGQVGSGLLDVASVLPFGKGAEAGVEGAAKGLPFLSRLYQGAKSASKLGGLLGFGQGVTTAASNNESAGNVAKSGLIGGVTGAGTGAVAGAAGAPFGSLISKLTGRTKATNSLVNEIANLNDSNAISNRLPGIDTATAHFLSNESDPAIVQSVLHQAADNAGVPFKNWVQAKAAPAGNSQPTALAPGMFDASNPPQSALPAGTHPPGSPDPVVVLSNAVKGKTEQEFVNYYKGLNGESRAVADSALNGKTPQEFYGLVKGDTSTPAYQRGYGQSGVSDKTPAKSPSATEQAYQAEQSALRETGTPSYQKQGNKAIFDAIVNHVQNGEIVDDATYLRRSRELAKAYDSEVNSLKGKSDLTARGGQEAIDKKYQEAKAQLDANHERTMALLSVGKPAEDQAVAAGKVPASAPPAPKTPQSGTAEPAPTGDIAPTNAAPADTTAPAGNTNEVSPASNPAIESVLSKLDEASKLHNPEAAAFSKQRGAALYRGEAAAQQAEGVDAHYAALQAMKGVKKQSGFQPIQVDRPTQDALISQIYNNPNLLPGEKMNAATGLLKVFGVGEGGTPTPGDISYIRKALGNDVADAVQQNVALAGKSTREKIAMVAATPKAAMATADLSAPLRQGGVLGARFPKIWAQNVKQSAQYFVNPKFFKEQMDSIKARPNFEIYKEMGLHVEAAEESTGTEEALQNSLLQTKTARKLLVGKPAMGADRAYSGFLTKLRADVADHYITNLKESGVWDEMTAQNKKDLGKFINTASGRGDLGGLERHAGLLSKALFSPRLWKSRLDLLNPVYYARLSGPARAEALKTSAAFASVAATTLGLASAAGATVVWDPRSADFAKIKIGNTRYDILGGLQQNIRIGAQMITGEKIDSSTGQVATLGPNRGFGKPSRKDLLYQFFENKENPLVGYASKLLQGTDQAGNPINAKTEAGKLLIPLNLQDVYSTGQDVGNYGKGAAMALPGFLGAGVQTYGTVPTKNQGKSVNGLPTWKGRIAPNMATDNNGQVLFDAKGNPLTVKFKGTETPAEKQAMLAKAQKAGLKIKAQNLLNPSDAQIYQIGKNDKSQLSPDQQVKFNQIDKWVNSYGQHSNIPEGVKSTLATETYSKYNSMDAADKKYWLSDKNPPDQSSIQITKLLNQQKAKGLSDFKPSNALAKAYADYEKDINSNPQYSVVDKRNKAKAFQVYAAKLQVGDTPKSIYNEGSSTDLRTLISNGKISKADLQKAINLDNELYASGLTGSLKFSKKFRREYGYGIPATYGTSGGSSGGGSGGGGSSSNKGPTAAQIKALIPSGSSSGSGTTAGLPQFSSRTRSAYLPGFASINLPHVNNVSDTRNERLVSPTPQKAKLTL